MSDRDRKAERLDLRRQTCRHFNGIQHKVCRAGVQYDALGPGRLPCLPPFRPNMPPGPTCDRLELPTEEEVRAEIAAEDALVAETVELLAAGKCPTCKAAAGRSRVGVCLYCDGCGARVGQAPRERR